MNFEENRLSTFKMWPANAPVDAVRIAKAGFYCIGNAEVQCFLCGIKISDWNNGDQAMVRHQQAAPNCPFVQNSSSTCNVPLVSCPTSTEAQSIFRNFSIGKDFSTIQQRLRSFANWPIPLHSTVTPEKLAKAGFYYLQHADMVRCVFCKGVLNDWQPGDDPDKEHRMHFPKCDFYMHKDEDDKEELAELGIQPHTAPRNPKYSMYEGRLKTFSGWPEHLQQTPEMLATAGFYYEDFEDSVRCFHCDGGLEKWEATDDAWVEHARWFPKCGFVNLIKSQKFIKECIDNRPDLDPSIFEGVEQSQVFPSTQKVTESNIDGQLNSPPPKGSIGVNIQQTEIRGALLAVVQKEIMEQFNRSSTPRYPISLLNSLSEFLTNRLSSRQMNNDTQNNECSTSSNEKTSKIRASRGKSVQIKDTATLEIENEILYEARLCKICMEREVAIVFLPCGHFVTCADCTPSLTECAVCRKEIRSTVRAFLS